VDAWPAIAGRSLTLLTAHDLLSSSSSSSSFPSTAASSHSSHVSFAAALRVRDERIRLLEGEVSQLAEYLSRFQHDFAGVCRMLGVRVSVRSVFAWRCVG
jgi:hypothetical protein